MKNTTFNKVEHTFAFLIKHRNIVVLTVFLLTVLMGFLASKIEVKTIFSDLLPKNHPYVEVNQKFKSTFGGSNLVTIMVETEQGDIFNEKVLSRVQKLTVGLQQVNGIDTYQIISIASKKIKEVRASTEGVETRPIMWPELPKDEEAMAKLRQAVLNNPLIYGPYVSLDLKATLITADFRDGEIDFAERFKVVHAITLQDLLPRATPVEAIDAELARSESWGWRENGVTMRESIVRGRVSDTVISRLRDIVRTEGEPWIRLAPWPAGFQGAFNFRFDLDEPDFEDWRQVVRIARGIRGGRHRPQVWSL